MMPDDQLARAQLAIDTKLKRADQAIARKQLALAEAQFEWQKSQAAHSGWGKLLTPTGVVLVGAALGLLGTAAGKWADYLTTKRQQETTIILKASEVPPGLSLDTQDVQRARNLLWFAEARYIELPTPFIDQLRKASKLKPGQTLPPPIVESQISAKAALSVAIVPDTVSIKPGGYREVKYRFSETSGVSATFETEDLRWILADGTVLDTSIRERIFGGSFAIGGGSQVTHQDNIYLPPEIAEAAQRHGASQVQLELAFNATDARARQVKAKAILKINVTAD
jgi:hypothetical protein